MLPVGWIDKSYFKYFLIVFAFSFVGAILGNLDITALTLLGALVQLVGTVAHVFIAIRRFHDTNHSGLFCLLLIIPFINFYALYLLFIKKGNPDVNQFGPAPGLE